MKSSIQTNYLERFSTWLLAFLVFWMPLEHRYDKPLRKFSLRLIPDGVVLPQGFEKKIYFYISDIIAIVLFTCLLFAFKAPLRRIFLEKRSLLLWGLFLSALISACLSPLAHYPVIYTRLLQVLTPIFLYCFIAETQFSEDKIKLILSAFVATALLQCAFAIIQYFTQEPLGLRIFAESRDIPATFSMPSGKRWILDYLFHYVSNSTMLKRASGTLNHSNLLGGLLMVSSIASYSLIANASKTWIKRLLGLSLIIQFFALCLTFSRSALFGWTIGTIAWFGWAFLSNQLRSYRFLGKITALAVLISSVLLFEQFLHRGGVVNYNQTVQSSDQVRIDAQSTAIKMIEDKPIFGVGFQQFATTSITYVDPNSETPLAHNVFLLLTAEMGLAALLAFLGFALILLIQAIKQPFTPQLGSLFSIFLAFLFISCCDFYPIHLQEGKLMFFIIAALLTAQTTKQGAICKI